jgi:hypothetical protein
MTHELRQQAARAFWLDEDATDDQVQAVMLIAQQKKFRPKFILGLDIDRKARHLATLGSLPDAIAARVLIVYHLAEQRPLMGTFLDALGIKHEDGLIQDDEVNPDPAKIGPAAAQIAQQFPAEHVSLYLNTLLCQDPQTWGVLEELPQRTVAGVP